MLPVYSVRAFYAVCKERCNPSENIYIYSYQYSAVVENKGVFACVGAFSKGAQN